MLGCKYKYTDTYRRVYWCWDVNISIQIRTVEYIGVGVVGSARVTEVRAVLGPGRVCLYKGVI